MPEKTLQKTTSYYPVYLNLQGKLCIIIGGGRIAEGKISKLLDSGCRVGVISPKVTPAIRDLSDRGSIEWQERKYRHGDLEGAFIAIAATDISSVNQEIFDEAESLGVLLNAVDDPPRCTFIAPSIVERGPVTLAISTGGASPALARKLRESLAEAPELEWADATGVLTKARKYLKANGVAVDPQRWQCCLTSDVLDLAKSGREEEALETLLVSLTGNVSIGLCSNIAECGAAGCNRRGRTR